VTHTIAAERPTEGGVLAMLAAAVQTATCMGVPQCIAIVNASAGDTGSIRMAGAKAQTAASVGQPSGSIPEAVRPAISAATDGRCPAAASRLVD
jgi:uncharacterized protein GlcG (DUF336 family)